MRYSRFLRLGGDIPSDGRPSEKAKHHKSVLYMLYLALPGPYLQFSLPALKQTKNCATTNNISLCSGKAVFRKFKWE
jgi:hypothetical protein